MGHVRDLRRGRVNPPDKIKIGTSGPPTPGVEIKLAEDGEVHVRGRVVMKGYRNLPEKTAETIDDDGWLHTGDIGEFDEDGYLKIVDRKKELIINAGGQEHVAGQHRGARQGLQPADRPGGGHRRRAALQRGADHPRPRRRARASSRQNGDTPRRGREAEEVQRGVDAANEKLARVEQIKKFKILPTRTGSPAATS